MKFILSMTAVFVLGLGVLTACQNAALSSKTETVKTNTNTISVVNSVQKADEHGNTNDAPRIALADAKKDFDAGNAIFVDTRAEVQYKQEHVKGAINIPAEAAETRWKEIPTDKKIIAYCSWPSEHTSAGLVAKLKEKGISNAFALVGGTQAWKDAGFPMESSASK